MFLASSIREAYQQVLKRATDDFNHGLAVDIAQEIFTDGIKGVHEDTLTWLFCSTHPSTIDLCVSKNYRSGIGNLVVRFRTEMVRPGLVADVVSEIIDCESYRIRNRINT